MLRADDVTFAYPRASASVLQSVSAAVERGGLLGIIGPNGSGKTTLLRLMAGTVKPLAGRVTLDGQPLAELPRRLVARRIAIVPQETHLAFDYTVLEIVMMGRHPHLGPFELEGPRDLEAARGALAATGTTHLERRLFATLSGGEKQRVVIAGALAQSAELLLLDEPTTSLDLGYQLEIAALLRQLNADRGVTMVLTTHDLNFAAAVCEQLVLLKAGRVLASGPTDTVLTPAAIRALYGVDADVWRHEAAGHLTVIPVRNVDGRLRESGPGTHP